MFYINASNHMHENNVIYKQEEVVNNNNITQIDNHHYIPKNNNMWTILLLIFSIGTSIIFYIIYHVLNKRYSKQQQDQLHNINVLHNEIYINNPHIIIYNVLSSVTKYLNPHYSHIFIYEDENKNDISINLSKITSENISQYIHQKNININWNFLQSKYNDKPINLFDQIKNNDNIQEIRKEYKLKNIEDLIQLLKKCNILIMRQYIYEYCF